jgi:hypothetical protein
MVPKLLFPYKVWNILTLQWLLASQEGLCFVEVVDSFSIINSLNAELNPIRHLLVLVGARHIVHVSRIRVNCFIHDHLYPLNTLISVHTVHLCAFLD